jgi:hypothetical protein
MKREAAISLSIAVCSLALLLPNNVQARTAKNPPDVPNTSTAGQGEAARMVPARAALVKTLDAKKMEPGQQFQATLSSKVQLKNGPELPRGTLLIGTVVNDNSQTSGTLKLALRFTQAQLKNGQTVPIRATIVGVFAPDSTESEETNTWNANTLRVDQENVQSGVDLHSSIDGDNSGVFVSAKKTDLKLSQGSGISLAIEAQGSNQQGVAGSNGGA